MMVPTRPCQEVVKKSQVSKWSQEVQIKKYCLRAIYVPAHLQALFAIVPIRRWCQYVSKWKSSKPRSSNQEVLFARNIRAGTICKHYLRAGTICQHYLPFYLMLHHCLLTLTWCAYVPHDQPLFITENDSMQQVQCNMMSIVNFFNRENY